MPRRSPGGSLGSLDLAGRIAGRIADPAGRIAAPAGITLGSLDLAGRIARRIADPAGDCKSDLQKHPDPDRKKDDPLIALPYGISPYIPSERITLSLIHI